MRSSGRAVASASKDRKRKAEVSDLDSSVSDSDVVEQSRMKKKSMEKEIMKEREAQ
jgi:hypothetical protein